MLKPTRDIWTVNILALCRAIIISEVRCLLSSVFDVVFIMLVPVLKATAAMAEELTCASTAYSCAIATRFHDQLHRFLIR